MIGIGGSIRLICGLAALAFGTAAFPAVSIERDLETFRKVFIEQDRALTASAREEAERQVRELAARAGELTPAQAQLGLARIVALADNAGSLVLDDPGSAAARLRLPMKVAWFPDGLLILRTSRGHADLTGGMILEVEGLPVAEVIRRLEPFYGGLLSRRRSMLPMLFEQPAMMRAAGLAKSADKLRLKIRTSKGRE